jgi:hypothetical protein
MHLLSITWLWLAGGGAIVRSVIITCCRAASSARASSCQPRTVPPAWARISRGVTPCGDVAPGGSSAAAPALASELCSASTAPHRFWLRPANCNRRRAQECTGVGDGGTHCSELPLPARSISACARIFGCARDPPPPLQTRRLAAAPCCHGSRVQVGPQSGNERKERWLGQVGSARAVLVGRRLDL